MYLLVEFQEDMNKQVSNEYSEQTRRAMAQMSEKEMNFDLIEVSSQLELWPHWGKLSNWTLTSLRYVVNLNFDLIEVSSQLKYLRDNGMIDMNELTRYNSTGIRNL